MVVIKPGFSQGALNRPTESTYLGVISLRGMRLLSFVSARTGLHLWTTDVGNAYLKALTKEKFCIEAGPELGPPNVGRLDVAGGLTQVVRAWELRIHGQCTVQQKRLPQR
jgi:hypothetical protein